MVVPSRRSYLTAATVDHACMGRGPSFPVKAQPVPVCVPRSRACQRALASPVPVGSVVGWHGLALGHPDGVIIGHVTRFFLEKKVTR